MADGRAVAGGRRAGAVGLTGRGASGAGERWHPQLDPDRPAYLALADSLARDLATGRLTPDDRLPSQRVLADRLGLNFSTIARGLREARARGLVRSRVGSGTHVLAQPDGTSARVRRRDLSDRTMNQAPEPQDPALLARMAEVWTGLGEELGALMRYQSPSGSAEDKSAAQRWLSRRGIEASDAQLVIAPGTHPAMLAILRSLSLVGDTVCCEDVTYPGIRGLCDHLNLRLEGLPGDAEGPDPAALDRAASRGRVAALYVNPGIRNPTTQTIGARRRAELAETCRRHRIPIIEDDAYGLLQTRPPPAMAMLAPELTWYVAGLSKCLGAGLRLAYVVAPRDASPERMTARLRAGNVTISPVTTRLATRWIETGTSDDILEHVRAESAWRQRLAADILPAGCCRTDPEGFHLWVRASHPWTRHRLVDWMRGHALGAIASDGFTAHGEPPDAFRLCLGGAATRQETREALEFLRDAFEHPPAS